MVLFFPSAFPVKERDVYFEVSAVIIAFVLLGRYMEEAIKKRSSASVRKLLDLRPAMARVIRNVKVDAGGRGIGEEETEIPANEVVVGDIMMVKPGEKIPTDGKVIDGMSAVDEKMITGESIPIDKQPGDDVIGATVNKQGLLKIKATKVGVETALSQIVHIVEEAQASTGHIQRLVDSVSAKFVPAVISIGITSFIIWYFVMGNFVLGLLSFIAVLIIACPCALGIATPAALMVGVGKGAEAGILIRGAEYLERSQKITTVLFDKTGTLTKGEPSVTDIVSFNGHSKKDVIMQAATIEAGSEHPLAQAIIREAKEHQKQHQQLEGVKLELVTQSPKQFEAISGMGVKAMVNHKLVLFGNRKLMDKYGIHSTENTFEQQMTNLQSEGKTVMILGVERYIAGLVAVADTLKDTSAAAINALKGLGIETVILTGDNEKTARAVARKVGIDNVIANVLP